MQFGETNNRTEILNIAELKTATVFRLHNTFVNYSVVNWWSNNRSIYSSFSIRVQSFNLPSYLIVKALSYFDVPGEDSQERRPNHDENSSHNGTPHLTTWKAIGIIMPIGSRYAIGRASILPYRRRRCLNLRAIFPTATQIVSIMGLLNLLMSSNIVEMKNPHRNDIIRAISPAFSTNMLTLLILWLSTSLFIFRAYLLIKRPVNNLQLEQIT